ncbi:facilitated trehalose transporter Tret1-like [Phymastichus coffea]|uniref:facilitated trehalose transporter Tret1-like n=1 Tax=Phymastichus coffea TaxID=108790 RepID=UPI00273B1784|nr:facilitated trehalose transporter Tret1-like [Phymastichus coffea]
MNMSAATFLIPCILLGALFFWLPNSPHWLVKIGDYESAKRSISWYQPGNDPDKELAIIKSMVGVSASEGFYQKMQKCRSEHVKRAIVLIVVLFTFMQLTGLNSVLFYMEIILARSKLKYIKPSLVVICVNASGMLASAISVCLIDKYGRKFLLILSCVGVTMSMSGLAANFHFVRMNLDISSLQLLPIFSVFLFVIAYFIGLMSIPSTILSEIFPSDIKCIAGCIASLVGAMWSFAATKSFQPLVDSIGEPSVFLLHGIFALILIPYVCLFMPETKGQSLQEIQDKLMKT